MTRSAGTTTALPAVPMSVLLPLLLLGLLVGSVTGCDDGADGPEPDRGAIRTGLAAAVARAEPAPGDADEGTCFANTLMGQTTPEQLRDAGVLDASYHMVERLPKLPEELAEVWAAAQLRCTDFVGLSAQAQAKLSHGGVDPEAYADCLHAALTDDQLRAALVDTLTGDWDGADLDRFTSAQGTCASRSHR
ncbi:MAG: hypothetical protein JWO76_2826 [Nocardioides sp.]|nr:hypothetical protein [Nocardioides sp.]